MKKALLIIGILIALILVVATILPSSKHVERSEAIDAPIDVVFDQVNDLRKNFNWSPWAEMDPNMKIEWGETTAGTGASYDWSGNSDVGVGTLTIAESIENEFIKNELDFGDMGKGIDTWKFETIFKEDENGDLNETVYVTWGMDFDLDWPIGRFYGLLMDEKVGKDFEKGLKNLKEVSEAMPVLPKINVEEVEFTEMTLISIKDSIAVKDIGSAIEEMLGEIEEVLIQQGIEEVSGPMSIYHVWNPEMGYTIMETGLVVPEGTEIAKNDRVGINVLSAGKAAKATHLGPYHNMNATHFAIDSWIESNSRVIAGPPWENYILFPLNESDSSKWITEIYYPIQ